MVVREGSNVTLKCAATGSPEPTITWRRENQELIELPNGTLGKLKHFNFLNTTEITCLVYVKHLGHGRRGATKKIYRKNQLIFILSCFRVSVFHLLVYFHFTHNIYYICRLVAFLW